MLIIINYLFETNITILKINIQKSIEWKIIFNWNGLLSVLYRKWIRIKMKIGILNYYLLYEYEQYTIV